MVVQAQPVQVLQPVHLALADQAQLQVHLVLAQQQALAELELKVQVHQVQAQVLQAQELEPVVQVHKNLLKSK